MFDSFLHRIRTDFIHYNYRQKRRDKYIFCFFTFVYMIIYRQFFNKHSLRRAFNNMRSGNSESEFYQNNRVLSRTLITSSSRCNESFFPVLCHRHSRRLSPYQFQPNSCHSSFLVCVHHCAMRVLVSATELYTSSAQIALQC